MGLARLPHPAILRGLALSILGLDPLSVSSFQAPDPRTWSSRTEVLPRARSLPPLVPLTPRGWRVQSSCDTSPHH